MRVRFLLLGVVVKNETAQVQQETGGRGAGGVINNLSLVLNVFVVKNKIALLIVQQEAGWGVPK